MNEYLDDHLSQILGRRRPLDHHAAKTLVALLVSTVAVTALIIGFAGQYAADHLSAETALRLSRGEVLHLTNPQAAEPRAMRLGVEGRLAAHENV